MSQTLKKRMGLALFLVIGMLALTGCGKSESADSGVKPATSAADAAKRTTPTDARMQQFAAQNAQGAEADAKMRAAAMAKAQKH